MNRTLCVLRLLLGLVVLAGAFAAPTSARAACDTVSFRVTNGYNDQVFVDVTNWTTRTRWLSILGPGQTATFSLEPGLFEFWANNYGYPGWDLSDGGVYPGCTLVGIKIRPVNNVPQFVIRSIQL